MLEKKNSDRWHHGIIKKGRLKAQGITLISVDKFIDFNLLIDITGLSGGMQIRVRRGCWDTI